MNFPVYVPILSLLCFAVLLLCFTLVTVTLVVVCVFLRSDVHSFFSEPLISEESAWSWDTNSPTPLMTKVSQVTFQTRRLFQIAK